MQIICTDSPITTVTQQLTAGLHAVADKEVLLLLSGGSWFAALDQLTDTAWCSSRVTIGLLDERFSADPSINNFAQLTTTDFYARAQAAGASYIDSRVQPDETHADYTLRLESAWQSWRTAHPTGVVMATLGMGADGHTAGLFPGSPALNSTNWIVSDTVPVAVTPFSQRTTTTPYFLHTEVTSAVALVTDAAKCAVLQQVIKQSEDVASLPARLWHTLPEVTVVTDCTD